MVGRVDHGMIDPEGRSRRGPQMSATPDSTLANPEQRIADLERQLAEREAELAEALPRETATGEVLQVINSSPGDLAPVFEAILEKALSLCEAALGSMVRFDGDAFHWLAARGVPEAWFAEFTTAAGYRPTPGLALYRFLHSGENIEHVADIAADDSGRSDIPDRRRFAELSGARTAIWVALRKDQALLGAFVIYRREVRPFSQKQIALLQNFAAQAVIAMENARLLGELRQRTEEVADLNRGLEVRVAEQVEELGRVGRLKRFLAPQLAELIVSHGDEKILESHRREIVVVFCRVTRLLHVSRAERVRFHMPDCPGKRRASRAADRSPDTLRWLYDFDPAAVPSAP